MSLVVIYEGQRKVVKVPNPNTLVQNVVVDAAQQFNVNPAQAYLQHKRTVLDKSQPFRFCGLSNNAQVDLVVTATPVSQKTKPCKIALAIEGHDNVMENVDSSLTLLEMLEYFVSIGKVPSSVFEMGPEIVYLRASYKGDEHLRGTTLAGLGLAGQSARLQLRFGGGAVTPRCTAGTTTASSSAPSPVPAGRANILTATIGATETSSSEPGSLMEVEATPSVPEAMTVTGQEAPALPAMEAPTVSPLPPSNTLQLAAGQQQQSSSGGESPTPYGSSAAVGSASPPDMSPAEALRALLSGNFDATSSPAVVTMAKYIMNVLLSPQDQRFRRINTLNKVFVNKVQPAAGAPQFLRSVGFRPAAEEPSTLLLVGQDGTLSAGQLARLEEGWEALQAAMKELDVPLAERPAGPEMTAAALRAEREARDQAQHQLERQVAFDPFRAHIVRAAPQPPREDGASARDSQAGLSATETQLLELQRKRALLEGDPSSVERCTEVVLPFSGVDSSSLGKSVAVEEDPASGGPVPRSVLQKILKRGGEDDEAPLTTAAVRELQRAQKERVYDRTLIRVKFPDRLQLQGYFHPRHTAQDVHDWVAQCLVPAAREASFELYTTPPRTVLAPLPAPALGKPSSRGTGNSSSSSCQDGGGSGGVPTLSDLKLVPAAALFLAWRGTAAAAETLSAPDRYLDSQLLKTAMTRAEDQRGAGAPSGSVAYPVGHQLVPQQQQRPAEEAQAKHGSSMGHASADGKGDQRKAFKPKWFK